MHVILTRYEVPTLKNNQDSIIEVILKIHVKKLLQPIQVVTRREALILEYFKEVLVEDKIQDLLQEGNMLHKQNHLPRLEIEDIKNI